MWTIWTRNSFRISISVHFRSASGLLPVADFKTRFKIDSIAQGKLAAIQARLKKNKEAEAEKKKAQKWANDISTMLMSDGPYEGNIEGAKRQVENIEKIMAENEKRRNENSSALPAERNRDFNDS